jgi:sugar lactone lactonase YvrE
MSHVNRVSLIVGVAIVTLTTISGDRVYAQDVDPNAAPNPYREDVGWAKTALGRPFGSTIGVDIDRDGKSVWVYDRCGGGTCQNSKIAPVMKFDPTGKLVAAFGSGLVNDPHGFYVDRDNNIWLTDFRGKDGKGHTVLKLSPDGKVLMTLGKPGVAGDGPDTFNSPTDVLIAPNGDIFVADGHGAQTNARIVKLSKEGKFIKAWGKEGKAPGEFDVPHGLAMDSQGRLFVADRANNRIQISTRMENSSPSGSSSAGQAGSSSTRTTLSMWPTRNRATRPIRASSKASESGAPRTARSRPSFRKLLMWEHWKASQQTIRAMSMAATPTR